MKHLPEAEKSTAANNAYNIRQQCHFYKPDSSETAITECYHKPLSRQLRSERLRQHAAETAGQAANLRCLALPFLLRVSVASQLLNSGGFPKGLNQQRDSLHKIHSLSPVTTIPEKDACCVCAPSASASPTAALTSSVLNNTFPTRLLTSRSRFSPGNKERQTPTRSSDDSQKARRRHLRPLSL